jgi:hypothetical protein
MSQFPINSSSNSATPEFLRETLYNTPIISQGISAGYAIAGDSAEAKRIQQKFLDDNVRGMQELYSGSWLRRFNRLATSGRLTRRAIWMSKYPRRKALQHAATRYT